MSELAANGAGAAAADLEGVAVLAVVGEDTVRDCVSAAGVRGWPLPYNRAPAIDGAAPDAAAGAAVVETGAGDDGSIRETGASGLPDSGFTRMGTGGDTGAARPTGTPFFGAGVV